jgi:hypothetical protein
MAKSMYAVVGTWTMAPGRWEEQVRGLHEQVVPQVRQVPGFVAGYWLGNRGESRTYTLILFEDGESAQHFRALVESDPMNREQAGVSLESLVLAEVVAEAHR